MKYANQELEEKILGSTIMINKSLSVLEFLEEKHFAFSEHRIIWNKIIEEISRIGSVDSVILTPFFKERFNLKALKNLMLQASGVIDIRDYGQELVELWQKRELEAKLQEALKDLESGTFKAISSNIENEIAGLTIQDTKKKTESVAQIINRIQEERKNKVFSKVMQTGFSELDRVIKGGVRTKQLVIIGGRAGIGKTTISQNILLNNGKSGKNCLFISLEMSKEEVIYKFTSNLARINSSDLQDGFLSQTEFEKRLQKENELKQMEIYINDSPKLKIKEIGKIIERQMEKMPIDLVVVDYVQIISADESRNKNEAQIIKENTTMLKTFAKQYDVAVIALAQINRNGAEMPKIQDLKGSGGIEEDADIVILIHRDIENSKFLNSGSLIVAKNRRGQTCDIPIKFEGEFGRFIEDL